MFNLFGGVFPLKFGKVGSMVYERERERAALALEETYDL
jgi:hypothetical protein